MAVKVNGTIIQIPQGDTGMVRFVAEEERITTEDRGVFTLARRDGTAILRKLMEPDVERNAFSMMFVYEDTARIRPGGYDWSLRIVRNGVFDGNGRLTAAQGQHTPVMKGRLQILSTAGGAR